MLSKPKDFGYQAFLDAELISDAPDAVVLPFETAFVNSYELLGTHLKGWTFLFFMHKTCEGRKTYQPGP